MKEDINEMEKNRMNECSGINSIEINVILSRKEDKQKNFKLAKKLDRFKKWVM